MEYCFCVITALLSEYFSKFWTSFDKLFSNIDDISHAVTDTIHMTAKHYNDKSFIEQFATRYLLREVHKMYTRSFGIGH